MQCCIGSGTKKIQQCDYLDFSNNGMGRHITEARQDREQGLGKQSPHRSASAVARLAGEALRPERQIQNPKDAAAVLAARERGNVLVGKALTELQ